MKRLNQLRTLVANPKNALYLAAHVFLVIIGFLTLQIGGPLLQAIGSSVIAAGIVGAVVFVYVLVNERTSERLEVLAKFGMRNAFISRGPRIKDEYERRLGKAREHIDVLGFGQQSLREDFYTEFSAWKERAKVRVLLIDPKFPSAKLSYAQQRDFEEGNTQDSIGKDVQDFIKATEQVRDGRFEVRLYKCLPSINVFRIDDELFWGPYLIGSQSRNCPTFIARSDGVMFDILMRHFEAIWQNESLSRPVPPGGVDEL